MNIYVGNLSFKSSEEDIRQAFSAFGEVKSVSIIKDKETGRSRGFAFVEMPSASEAQAAISAMNGKDFGGRVLTVNEARPREERAPRGPRRDEGGDRSYYRDGERRGGGGRDRDRDW